MGLVFEFLLSDKYEYTHGTCNSGQYIYVTGLFNIFFVLQDLINTVDSSFQRKAFQRNLLVIGFQHSTLQFFSNKNNGNFTGMVLHTCKEQSW